MNTSGLQPVQDFRAEAGAQSRPAVAVQQAVKTFGATKALAGVSLELRRGEFLGLLGPNGAGKSTLIRSLVGRVRLDAGSVAINGAQAGSEEARIALGYVPQDLALYPKLTAEENLSTFGQFLGLTGAKLRESIAWCLDWAALTDRRREPVGGLSGGMKRRLNMAAGLIHHPQICLDG